MDYLIIKLLKMGKTTSNKIQRRINAIIKCAKRLNNQKTVKTEKKKYKNKSIKKRKERKERRQRRERKEKKERKKEKHNIANNHEEVIHIKEKPRNIIVKDNTFKPPNALRKDINFKIRDEECEDNGLLDVNLDLNIK